MTLTCGDLLANSPHFPCRLPTVSTTVSSTGSRGTRDACVEPDELEVERRVTYKTRPRLQQRLRESPLSAIVTSKSHIIRTIYTKSIAYRSISAVQSVQLFDPALYAPFS